MAGANMLHLIYILAFTTVAILAIANLIRSLFTVGIESQRSYYGNKNGPQNPSTLHPELLDESGNFIDEPLLVMRSVSMQDAREQLDALYNNDPQNDKREDS
jgi:hypothetical protein